MNSTRRRAIFTAALILAAVSGCSSMQSTGGSDDSAKAGKAAAADNQLDSAQKDAKRKSLQDMADQTVKEILAKDPTVKEKLEKAYGYAVFDDSVYNAVLYVGGNGNGVAYVNSTKAPTYMIMLRAGTGPGVGYTKFRQLLIIANKTAYEEFTTVGLDVGASANATFKVDDFGSSVLAAGSFNPYLHVYTITDSGVDIQANWGGMEYLRNTGLNE